MAEGIAKTKYGKEHEFHSAGTNPAMYVSPNGIEALKELGIDIASNEPKGIHDIPENMDILIIMGQDVPNVFVDRGFEENWNIEDPYGMDFDTFKRTRDRISEKIDQLIVRIDNGDYKRG